MSWLLVLFMTASVAQLEPGDYRRTVIVDGVERSYLLHLPPAAKDRQPLPVVLAFHGGGSHAAQMVAFSGLNDKADQEGFAAVYPEGTGRVEGVHTWNAGNCCGYAMRHEINDVRYVVRLLDDLKDAAAIDPSRIYATGMSNGAMMCYRLACEIPERIAAIAPVGGPMGFADCSPARPVPVCHFHGVDDQFAPYNGGRGARSLSRTEFYSVDHTICCWVRGNGCHPEPEVTELPAPHNDGTRITLAVYTGGREGAEVRLYTIHGGGHTWPGRQPVLRYLGPSTKNLSANDAMWEFFQRFRR